MNPSTAQARVVVDELIRGGVRDVVPVDLHIRGCPPSPTQFLKGLLALLEHDARNGGDGAGG